MKTYEYAAYVPRLVVLLEEGANVEQIARYLSDIASEQMGLGANDKHSRAMAELLIGTNDWLVKRYSPDGLVRR